MPVSGVSGSLSTGVYFTAMFLLLFALTPPVRAAYEDANLRAAQQIASGLGAQIDGLAPGMVSRLSFQSSPGEAVTVKIDGESVTATVNGVSSAFTVRWNMGSADLAAGSVYDVSIRADAGSGGGDHGDTTYVGVVAYVP